MELTNSITAVADNGHQEPPCMLERREAGSSFSHTRTVDRAGAHFLRTFWLLDLCVYKKRQQYSLFVLKY